MLNVYHGDEGYFIAFESPSVSVALAQRVSPFYRDRWTADAALELKRREPEFRQPAEFPPITRHPDHEVYGRPEHRWTVAEGERRHLAAGPLAAARMAIKRQIRAIESGEKPGTAALKANLAAALVALEGCDYGDFRPGYSVDVLSREEWAQKHSDYKGGDPAKGTARYVRRDDRAGTVLARCVVEG